jgi:hypothetical protein
MARRTQADERASGAPELKPDGEAPQTSSAQDGNSRVELIARRAYERFQMRGGEHGRDQDDWLEAERELNQDTEEPGSKP